MKIFLIARGYPSQQEPTWGCFERDQAEALAKMGHQVIILSVDTRFRSYWRPLGISKQIINHVTIYNLFLFPFAILFFLPASIRERFCSLLFTILAKYAISKEGKPDIMCAHYLHFMQHALHIRKKYHIPLVGIEHWSEMGRDEIYHEVIQLAQGIYPQIDKLITVSTFLKDNIQRYIPLDDIRVVGNLIGSEFYYQPTRSQHPLTLLSVGRLVEGKRFDLLISALSNIKDVLPQDWQALIIGDGKMKHTLQQLINELALQDHVHLLGAKSKSDIIAIMQQSDLFVLPSAQETFGVVYIEDLACGLPIIATDCGGPRDIVTPQNGLLIPKSNTAELEKAILYIVNNLDKYNRKAIAEDCQMRFSSQVIAQELTQIFKDTIKTAKNKQ